MTCEKPVIAPITDECCFDCYTEGRGSYQAPIAVVLHEVDEHIEALNNRMENCCGLDPDCHRSFHYGVGHDGRIINWVDPENTAFSFDPINADQTCGTCGWSISIQEGAAVDPNLYTVNIAVSTGILAFDQSSHNSLAQNNYTEQQYDSLVRLVGWLAETYSITVNQNLIWRHCDELDDFPSGCCCAECGPCETYSDFLVDVQNCIDSTEMVLPWLCDAICDAPVTVGSPIYVFGADQNCDTCGRYELSAVVGPQPDICNLLLNIPIATTDAIPQSTMLVGRDCNSYFLPAPPDPVCEQVLALPAETAPDRFLVLGDDGQGVCSLTAVDNSCDVGTVAHAALSVDPSNGDLGVHPVSQHLTHREAGNGDDLIPATDRVVLLDASTSSIIFTLAAPAACDPQDFWIKRRDCTPANTVTVNGGAQTIDGQTVIPLGTPGPFGNCGESIHIYWTGTDWTIL